MKASKSHVWLLAAISGLLLSCSNEKLYQNPTSSMEPTIRKDATFTVDSRAYKNRMPERFDLVLVVSPENVETILARRIFGMPGDVISFPNDRLHINSETPMLPDEISHRIYSLKVVQGDHGPLPFARTKVEHPYTVPDGHYYVMGDNPEIAVDSRNFRAVPAKSIMGKVAAIMNPRE